MLLLAKGHGAPVQRLVFLIFQIPALVVLKYFVIPAQHRIRQGLCNIIGIAVPGPYLHIILHRVHTEGQVAWKGPGRGGPCQDIGVLVLYLKPRDGGAFLYILIALGHLVGGKGGSAARTVGNHFKALV